VPNIQKYDLLADFRRGAELQDRLQRVEQEHRGDAGEDDGVTIGFSPIAQNVDEGGGDRSADEGASRDRKQRVQSEAAEDDCE
jgi:hypothetical protein